MFSQQLFLSLNPRGLRAVCLLGFWLGAAAVAGLTVSVQTASAHAAGHVDYSRDIRPLLARKCYACHGPETKEGGLALHEASTVGAELDSGEIAIQAGDPDASELIVRIRTQDEDLRMPPTGHDPLTEAEIKLLEDWIAQGAVFNDHWAFEKMPLVSVPPAVSPEASAHPIDRFIDAQLYEKGLQKAPPADRRTLIRRVTYDLTGLPPTPEEVQAFVADTDPQAYEKLVDRLLASPQYGERWARHWLDLVRYAETNSYERDNTKPNAWKYRDYVIRSFNEDKPYDQFLKEQLAGDEFPEPTKDSLIATGFYRLGIWDDEPADPLLARYDEFDDLVTTITQGFLGLTVSCSRCHDHKIDPIPQADYYKMVAFLQGLTPYATRNDENIYSQTDVTSPELNARYADLDQQLRTLHQEMYDLEQTGVVKMPAEDQRATETNARKKVLEQKLKDYLDPELWPDYEQMKAREKQIRDEQKRLPPREMVLSVAKENPRPETSHIMFRGNPHVPGDEVKPGFPELFREPDPVLPEVPENARTSGRRTILANWIASPENRLTSRVMVNRVWQHHFGRGLVRSSNNFGFMGTPPTHPDLLNWLSQQFVENGWRLKPLHRLIVTSEAYQRSSTAVEESLAKDPINDSFWRFDLRRLSAEEIRDSVLAAAGTLNLKMHGPSIYPDLSKEVLATQSVPGKGWGKSSREEQHRRSVYIFVKRSLLPPELATFDFPETDVTCEARFTTIQPAQALNMVNGDFLNRQADYLAERLRKLSSDRSTQVEQGWQLVTLRQPTAAEKADSLAFIEKLQADHQLSDDLALKYFSLYLLNLNEFLFVD